MQALLLLLGSLLDHHRKSTHVDPQNLPISDLLAEVTPWVQPVLTELEKLTDAEIRDRFARKYGSGGPTVYYFELAKLVREHVPDFAPAGLREYVEEVADKRVLETNQRLQKLVADIQELFSTP